MLKLAFSDKKCEHNSVIDHQNNRPAMINHVTTIGRFQRCKQTWNYGILYRIITSHLLLSELDPNCHLENNREYLHNNLSYIFTFIVRSVFVFMLHFLFNLCDGLDPLCDYSLPVFPVRFPDCFLAKLLDSYVVVSQIMKNKSSLLFNCLGEQNTWLSLNKSHNIYRILGTIYSQLTVRS